MMKRYSVAITGSTDTTLSCATALFNDVRFVITSVITPMPKVIGRKQILTKNPLHIFAIEKGIETVLVEKKIDAVCKENIEKLPKPDFLLVVDFGYIIPSWLLEWPAIAPLNIHPSLLPRWRGSSPGQFVLLYGEKESAVTLMVMDAQLDHGPLITQIPFTVKEKWTQAEYYAKSFEVICQKLPGLLVTFAENPGVATPQPEVSPTGIAGRFQREDGFIDWSLLEKMMNNGETIGVTDLEKLSPVLVQAFQENHSIVETLFHATFALQPWPGVWTMIPTEAGEKRMKILDVEIKNEKLVLKTVQLDGKNPTRWEDVSHTF